MKITELEQMPHLYLDMDGVQADLYNAMAKREKAKHWDDIPDQNQAITKLSLRGPLEVYQLFRELEPLSGGQIIIHWLHKNKIPFTVLSAPLRNEQQASIDAKRDWLDQHNPGSSETAIFTKEKFKYAITNGHPNVLVDDFNYYLDSWTEAGGIAVKHSQATTDQTIAKLEEIYALWIGDK
jgi:5' nucleotidase, deoxy (Pyrimidine), cytosolic type C protein (NT5C)